MANFEQLILTKKFTYVDQTKISEMDGCPSKGRVAWWLATCAWKPKVPGSSPAASYAQR